MGRRGCGPACPALRLRLLPRLNGASFLALRASVSRDPLYVRPSGGMHAPEQCLPLQPAVVVPCQMRLEGLRARVPLAKPTLQSRLAWDGRELTHVFSRLAVSTNA